MDIEKRETGRRSRATRNNKRDRRTEKLYEQFMSAIIRSRVTQYRLIIEDEVQAGRQALTYALNSRPRQPGWLPYFRLFFFFHFFLHSPLHVALSLSLSLSLCPTDSVGSRTLIIANASLLFQSLSLTARHRRGETRGTRNRLFRFVVNRSRTSSHRSPDQRV